MVQSYQAWLKSSREPWNMGVLDFAFPLLRHASLSRLFRSLPGFRFWFANLEIVGMMLG